MENNELMHYGVPGMKWGVKRASKKLAKADTAEKRDKAIASLNKHRGKAVKKIEKLNKQRVKLQKDADNIALKYNPKISRLQVQSAAKKIQAGSFFTSKIRAEKLMNDAKKLDMKSDLLKASVMKAKANIEKNETLTRLFKEGINDIDTALASKGKRVMSKKK